MSGMPRPRVIAGWITVCLLALSTWMHSVEGWRGMRTGLAAANAPPDLVAGLEAGWLFGGVFLMVTAVLLVAWLRAGSPRPAGLGRALRWIAVSLIAYAVLALVRYDGNPFFLVFAVLGGGTWVVAAEP